MQQVQYCFAMFRKSFSVERIQSMVDQLIHYAQMTYRNCSCLSLNRPWTDICFGTSILGNALIVITVV